MDDIDLNEDLTFDWTVVGNATLSNEELETATLTLGPVAASQQSVVVTLTVTDTNNVSGSDDVTFMIRANLNPTVMITTAGGTRDPGQVISLAADVTPPESGQTVTVLWEITSGGGTLTNETSLYECQYHTACTGRC